MPKTIDTITDVVACNLCTGCGACAGAFPRAIEMIEDPVEGRRPVARAPGGAEDRAALEVCAGHAVPDWSATDQIEADWGPVLACWEGHAADPEIRHAGSSGGAATALSLFALQSGQAQGVAHIRACPDDPRLNETTISRDRAGLLSGTGSRYAQSSPLDIMPKVAAEDGRIAFVGKPCDVASLTRMRQRDADLAARVGVTIAIFCAGAPNLVATERLLDRLGVPKTARLTDLRYRGNGWPGLMQASWTDEAGQDHTSEGIPYGEGWGQILQTGRRWRCRICDDHTGALADISVGDPWHTPPAGNTDAGRSLIVARTAEGRALVEAAIAGGALIAQPQARDVIARAQPNLLATNAAAWGRRTAMRMVGMPVPKATSASSFAIWRRRLSVHDKASSILGTLKRIWRQKLWRPVRLNAAGTE